MNFIGKANLYYIQCKYPHSKHQTILESHNRGWQYIRHNSTLVECLDWDKYLEKGRTRFGEDCFVELKDVTNAINFLRAFHKTSVYSEYKFRIIKKEVLIKLFKILEPIDPQEILLTDDRSD